MRKCLLLVVLILILIEISSCKKEQFEEEKTIIISPDGNKIEFSDGSYVNIPPNTIKSGTEVVITKKDLSDLKIPGNTNQSSSIFRMKFDFDAVVMDSNKKKGLLDSIPSDTISIITSIEDRENLCTRFAVITSSDTFFFYQNVFDTLNLKKMCLFSLGLLKNIYLKDISGDVILEFMVLSFGDDYGSDEKGLIGTLYKITSVDTSGYIEISSPVSLGGKIPLILVHGWTLEFDNEYVYIIGRKICVYANWSSFIAYFLNNSSLNQKYMLFAYRYDRDVPIDASANALKELIDNVFPNDSVVLIGHSMGGLVSRAYIVNKGGYSKVKRLITLATPHHGSPLANIAMGDENLLSSVIPLPFPCLPKPSTFNLRWDNYEVPLSFPIINDYLSQLNSNDTYKSRYKILYSEGIYNNHGLSYSAGDLLICFLLNYPSDGAVPRKSGNWDGAGPFDGAPVTFSDYDHTQMVHDKPNGMLFTTIKDYLLSITGSTNNPPNTPSTPTGPTSGNVNTSYNFSSSATDPNGDNVAIMFDWGDGTTSSWSSYVSSGSQVTMSHSWSSPGTYQVKAKAKDINGLESGWSSTLTVNITNVIFGEDFNNYSPGSRPDPTKWVIEITNPSDAIVVSNGYSGNALRLYDPTVDTAANADFSYASLIAKINGNPDSIVFYVYSQTNNYDIGFRSVGDTNDFDSTRSWYLNFSGGKLKYKDYIGRSDSFITVTSLSNGTWYKLKLKFDWINKNYDIYVNNVYKTNAPFVSNNPGGNYIHIIEFWDNEISTDYFLIDEIYLYGSVKGILNSKPIIVKTGSKNIYKK